MLRRKAKYAGVLYPADADFLSTQIAERLLLAKSEQVQAKMLLVPGERSLSSAATVARAYRSLQYNCHLIKQVVLVTLNYQAPDNTCILTNYLEFETPLGNLPLATQTIEQLSLFPGATIANEYHLDSLSTELNLSFLQLCLVDFKLVPVVIGQQSSDALFDLMTCMLKRPDTLIVVSVDWPEESLDDVYLALAYQCQQKPPDRTQPLSSLLTIMCRLIDRHKLVVNVLKEQVVSSELGIAAIFSQA